MPEGEPKNIRCPRCKGKRLVIYDDSFDCIDCNLEFEKADLLLYEEENILSIEEKLATLDGFNKK